MKDDLQKHFCNIRWCGGRKITENITKKDEVKKVNKH